MLAKILQTLIAILSASWLCLASAPRQTNTELRLTPIEVPAEMFKDYFANGHISFDPNRDVLYETAITKRSIFQPHKFTVEMREFDLQTKKVRTLFTKKWDKKNEYAIVSSTPLFYQQKVLLPEVEGTTINLRELTTQSVLHKLELVDAEELQIRMSAFAEEAVIINQQLNTLVAYRSKKLREEENWETHFWIWNLKDDKLLASRTLDKFAPAAVTFIDDGKEMVVAGQTGNDYTGKVVVLDSLTGKVLATQEKQTGAFLASASLDHGQRVYVSGFKGRVYRFEGPQLESGEEFIGWRSLKGKYTVSWGNHVYCLAQSPDDKVLAAGIGNWSGGNWYGGIRLFDSNSGKLLLSPIEQQSTPVYEVIFSPNGKYFAAASSGGKRGAVLLRIWKVERE